VSGGLVVGNLDMAGDKNPAGYAFIYDPATGEQTPIVYPKSSRSLTHTAYGIWWNGGSSYTISGGQGLSKPAATSGSDGDVLLFQDRFIPGAAAFLIGHLAYIVALAPIEHPLPAVAFGLVIVGAFAISLGRCIVRGAWRQSPVLGGIVIAYMVTIGAVVVLAVGSWSTVAGIAALLFMASDTLLAWGRFVGSAPGGRVAVMVTYQLAQAGFVLAIPTLVP